MEAVAEASGPDFQHRAYEFAVKFFREHGKASAEDCTEAMLAAGIRRTICAQWVTSTSAR